LYVAVTSRDGVTVPFVRHDKLRVSSVDMETGEPGLITEIFRAAAAELADPTG
jgi:hypothetical protein